MTFEHYWKNKEANFSAPVVKEVRGGAHVSFEILPSFEGKYLLVRRPHGVPGHVLPPEASLSSQGLLYLCYDLIRRAESTEQCIARIIKDQIQVGIRSYRTANFYSFVHSENDNWALIPCFVVELDSMPATSELITEVVQFGKHNIPGDIAWWTAEHLKSLMG